MAEKDAQQIARSIVEGYTQKTRGSAGQNTLAKEYLPGGDTRSATYFNPYPIYMTRGEGCRLYDVDGNCYLDFLNNYSSLIHGHAHPKIVEKAQAQLESGTVLGGPSKVQQLHAAHLKNRMPSLELLRYCNSGTEATLFAMRAVRAYTGRDVIIKMDGGYHGSHDFVEANVQSHANQSGPVAVQLDTRGVPACVLEQLRVVPFNDAEAVETILKKEAHNIAAVIVEPLLGAGGVIPPLEGYLQKLRALTDQYGVLLIFDEVMTFRLSTGGMQLIYDLRPDLTALGKIIGGGFPVGAFGGRKEIMALFDPNRHNGLAHSGTFNGNNITLSAGLAALELYDSKSVARINRLGERLRQGFNRAFRDAGIAGQAIGVGSFIGVHWYREPITNAFHVAQSKAAAGELTKLLHLELINNGIYSADRGMFVVSTPMTESEIDTANEVFAKALNVIKPYIAAKIPFLLV